MSYMITKIKIILTLSYHIYIVFNNKTYFDCLNLTENEFLNFFILCIFSLGFLFLVLCQGQEPRYQLSTFHFWLPI